MPLNLDVSKLTQSAAMKPTAHDNCTVLDLGTGGFPRDIEVRLPDDDGARQNALWDGSLNLDVNDEVLCFEYSGISAWRIMAMGGNDGGAGKARVSEVWESDFGDVALQSDADGNIVIGSAGPAGAALEVFSTTQAQLRLAFGATKYAEFSFDTSHLLTIDTTSVGHILLNATVRIVDEILHEGDFNTKIGLDDDKFSLTVGGLLMIEAIEIAGQDTLDLGDVAGGGDVDISFNADQMFLQGSSGNLAIGGFTNPNAKLFVGNVTLGVLAGFGMVLSDSGANSQMRIGQDIGARLQIRWNYDAVLANSSGSIFISTGQDLFIQESGGNTSLGHLGAPQGILHSYDSISGFLLWEFDGLNATVRTVVANGTGDILYRLTAMYVLRDSAAAVASGTTDVSNGASVNLTVGGNTVRLRVNADGSCDIARTAGTDTIKVTLVLRWL